MDHRRKPVLGGAPFLCTPFRSASLKDGQKPRFLRTPHGGFHRGMSPTLDAWRNRRWPFPTMRLRLLLFVLKPLADRRSRACVASPIRLLELERAAQGGLGPLQELIAFVPNHEKMVQ